MLIQTDTDDISEIIIGAAYKVYNKLGYGFLEKVYENSMVLELNHFGLKAQNQVPVSVFYDGVVVGEYFADIFVESEIIVELKTVQSLAAIHKAQLLNYLRATNKRVGLLINFGPSKVEVNRVLNK